MPRLQTLSGGRGERARTGVKWARTGTSAGIRRGASVGRLQASQMTSSASVSPAKKLESVPDLRGGRKREGAQGRSGRWRRQWEKSRSEDGDGGNGVFGLQSITLGCSPSQMVVVLLSPSEWAGALLRSGGTAINLDADHL